MQGYFALSGTGQTIPKPRIIYISLRKNKILKVLYRLNKLLKRCIGQSFTHMELNDGDEKMNIDNDNLGETDT